VGKEENVKAEREMVHASNPSTGEAEVGGSGVKRPAGLNSTHCLQNKTKQKAHRQTRGGGKGGK
jgi:hypothetical protein